MAREGKAGITVDEDVRDDFAEHKLPGETWDELFRRAIDALGGDESAATSAQGVGVGAHQIQVELGGREEFITEVAERTADELAGRVEVRIDAETLAKRIKTRMNRDSGVTAPEVEEIVRETTRSVMEEAFREAMDGVRGGRGGSF